MTSMFRFVLSALVGALLTAFGLIHEIRGHPGAEFLRRKIESTAVLKGVVSIPAAIVVAIIGLVMMATAIYRVRILWKLHHFSNQRHLMAMPLVGRAPRRIPAAQSEPVEDEFDGDEYGPIDSYDAPHPPGYRGNGQFDSRGAESYP
jgi:hypothetical protein